MSDRVVTEVNFNTRLKDYRKGKMQTVIANYYQMPLQSPDSTFCLIMQLVCSACIWGSESFLGFKRDDLRVLPSDRMLPGEAVNGVGMNRSVREGKKCKAL